ncbi:MAG: DUF2271 domain-containing protein [Colwellia sp.]|nr:DUF2271 domain-containing protein [Colwellia sp.]
MNIKIVGLIIMLLTLISFTTDAHKNTLHPTEITIELALKQQSGEYHRPYVASWIESSKGKSVRTLLLWREQAKWLKDIRRWWRKAGRKDAALVDGITAATRAAGKFKLSFLAQDDDKKSLENGQYTLFIEVVRENGGRAIIRQPFSLNGNKETFTLAATNETEQIKFSVNPK